MEDGIAALKLQQLIEPKDFSRLETIAADHKSHHHILQAWMTEHQPAWCIEVKMGQE
jgi:hypothetical protein